MKLISPHGSEIIGTLETIIGYAAFQEPKLDENGKIDFEYSGETEINWNEQKTVERDGGRVFVDEDGREFNESQLKLVD